MNDPTESAYWAGLVRDLQQHFTLEDIAEEMKVSVRMVSYWKNGDQPKGLRAVRLYLFHMKHGSALHGAGEVKA